MSSAKFLILISIAAASVCIDQMSKLYVHTQMMLGESIPVINDLFSVTYVRNLGAAFGFLSDAHPSFRGIFFLALPPVAMLAILLLLNSHKDEEKAQIMALAAIFGGALGNYIDRVRFGYVIDFIDFHYKNNYHYPAFNVADISIVCGVIVLFFTIFFEYLEERKQLKSAKVSSKQS